MAGWGRQRRVFALTCGVLHPAWLVLYASSGRGVLLRQLPLKGCLRPGRGQGPRSVGFCLGCSLGSAAVGTGDPCKEAGSNPGLLPQRFCLVNSPVRSNPDLAALGGATRQGVYSPWWPASCLESLPVLPEALGVGRTGRFPVCQGSIARSRTRSEAELPNNYPPWV